MTKEGSGFYDPSDGMERAREAFSLMYSCVLDGGKIIIGTEEAYPIGHLVIRVDDGEAFIKRRATRQEYLTYCPNQDLAARHPHVPFYWELELKKVTH